ncbi:MAG: NAD(P)/FAD-dependent oxidoreductase [Flavobacteriales bacterium]|nr:NAD(P)/FAD-dependent oxidoreductase [Flavobacteriales bacterium]
MKVIIIGAGIGGLSSALNLANNGVEVVVIEATSSVGGLAKSLTYDSMRFDAGPYILLDKPGLKWALEYHNLDLELLRLNKIEDIYSVCQDATKFKFKHNLEWTANQFETLWKGQGHRYQQFVESIKKKYESLFPFTFSKPSPLKLITQGKFGLIPFLLSSLGDTLDKFKLNESIKSGIGIWTHIAAQSLYKAPSPMAFVPNLMHNVGSYYPQNGIGSIAEMLYEKCLQRGVEFLFDSKVERIKIKNGSAIGVNLPKEFILADKILSNNNALGTYLELIPETQTQFKNQLTKMPLQSPGICVFLKVKGNPNQSYIQFKLERQLPNCKSFIMPSLVLPDNEEWKPARLIFPLPHSYANKLTDEASLEHINAVLDQKWWQEGINDFEMIAYNTPGSWEQKFALYNRSMNPVMTAEFMRKGRMPHKSPHFQNLYFAGSSTHPGQWVSFCAISGILSSNQMLKDS